MCHLVTKTVYFVVNWLKGSYFYVTTCASDCTRRSGNRIDCKGFCNLWRLSKGLLWWRKMLSLVWKRCKRIQKSCSAVSSSPRVEPNLLNLFPLRVAIEQVTTMLRWPFMSTRSCEEIWLQAPSKQETWRLSIYYMETKSSWPTVKETAEINGEWQDLEKSLD